MEYRSTRGLERKVKSSRAIVQGLSKDGGLFVPEKMPEIDFDLKDLEGFTYKELAYRIMSKFFTDFTEAELKYCIENAYNNKFDDEKIAPIKECKECTYLELYHGPTMAFKDMALSILPYLMTTAAKKLNIKKELVILTATSGDTGKAAMEGFGSVDGTKVIVFYPKDGVSPFQEKQMLTTVHKNTYAIAINGNFDNAQSGVKEIFGDEDLKDLLDKKDIMLSSANSINIGRLVPQVVYYFYGYGQMVKNGTINTGEKINIVVPTGNFGNILAAYYAKVMGLPINNLICASNKNKVLVDFFNLGVYNKNRDFYVTSSPSMDILISSNLERLIFEICNRNSDRCRELMTGLLSKGEYKITEEEKNNLKDFFGDFCDENETVDEIKKVFNDNSYLIDPHTAVASRVYGKYKALSKDLTKAIISSTASPYKFSLTVAKALDIIKDKPNPFEVSYEIYNKTKMEIPKVFKEVMDLSEKQKTEIEVFNMKNEVLKILKIK